MSTENKDQQLDQQIDPTKETQTEISSAPQPQTGITDEVKKLLNSLIKKNLEKRIRRLENRNEDQNKNVKIIKTNFKNFESQIKSIIKNVEETQKRKEAKKKEETPKKSRLNTSKHSLASKSVPPGKKKILPLKTEYNTNKIGEKKKININTSNFKTEVNVDKDAHNRSKTF